MNTGTLTYNGKNSLTDFNIYVTGSGSFDAAELDYDRYEIAGRNGDLIIPKNRYKNIQVSYPAFIPKAFMNGVQSVRNWMRSSKVYARLEDTYDVNHFRMGLANGVQSFEPANRNDASNFQLNFNCRPERFLKSGETPLTIQPESHSYSGDIVSFETVAVDDLTKATVTLSPIQSLNGYDHPWAGGAGKNKMSVESVSLGGSNDRTYSANIGTIPAGTYFFSCTKTGTATGTFGIQFIDANNSLVGQIGAASGSLTLSGDAAKIYAFMSTADYNNGLTVILSKIQVESGSSATTFSPYSNICPISGHDGATLNIGTEYPTAVHSYPVSFSSYGTVYGGTFDFVSGKLTITHTYAAGSALTWSYISQYHLAYAFFSGKAIKANRDNFYCSDYKVVDKYYTSMVSGETSATNNNTGINVRNDSWSSLTDAEAALANTQFVYELATPIEIDLTPAQISTLNGLNNVWADGEISVEYADPFNVENPTYFDARPLFEITNPAANDVLSVNSIDVTFTTGYTGTVVIDCETMNAYSGMTNANYLISATDFPILSEGTNIVTWSGSGEVKMTPRWWEL